MRSSNEGVPPVTTFAAGSITVYRRTFDYWKNAQTILGRKRRRHKDFNSRRVATFDVGLRGNIGSSCLLIKRKFASSVVDLQAQPQHTIWPSLDIAWC